MTPDQITVLRAAAERHSVQLVYADIEREVAGANMEEYPDYAPLEVNFPAGHYRLLLSMANPSTVLSLLADLEQAQDEVERLKEVIGLAERALNSATVRFQAIAQGEIPPVKEAHAYAEKALCAIASARAAIQADGGR